MPITTPRGESGSRRGGCPNHRVGRVRHAVPIMGIPPRAFGSTKTARRSGVRLRLVCSARAHAARRRDHVGWMSFGASKGSRCRRIIITPSWPQGPVSSKGPHCVTRASRGGGEDAVEGFEEPNVPISLRQAPNLCVSGSPKLVLLHLPWASVCCGVLTPELESPATAQRRYS